MIVEQLKRWRDRTGEVAPERFYAAVAPLVPEIIDTLLAQMKEIQEFSEMVRGRETDNENLQSRLAIHIAHVSDLESALDKLRPAADRSSVLLQEKEAEIRQLNETMREQASEIIQLRNQLDTKQMEIDRISSNVLELAIARQKAERLESEAREFKSRIAEMQSEIDRLKRAINIAISTLNA